MRSGHRRVQHWHPARMVTPLGVAVLGVASLALATAGGCGASTQAATSPSKAGASATGSSTTTRLRPALPVPAGTTTEPPTLLAQARSLCATAGQPNQYCAGALDAVVWGYPLLATTKLLDQRACTTGLDKLDDQTTLAGPTSTSVVLPNDDTLYSTAFLDLAAGPVVLSVPSVRGRYLDIQLLDMYTNTFADIGVLTDGGHSGTYAVVAPHWHGALPAGMHEIEAPTPEVWLLGRTEVDGPDDLRAAVATEHEYRLAPLDRPTSSPASGPKPAECAKSPGATASPGIDVLDEISADMEANPPLPQDTAAVDAMASVGIAAGRGPVHTTVDARLTAYRVGLALGSRLIAQSEDAVVRTTATGWHTHEVAGSFGTDYTDRAAVARFGLGQQVPSQAVYLSATTAESGTKLDGERTFTLTFPKGKLPPLGKDGFWSITMYDNNEHLVANPIKRYSIGSHSSGLVATANGAIEIVMSATKPAGRDVNWLPAPGAAFEIVLRVYSPGSAVIDGKWTPPAVQLYKH